MINTKKKKLIQCCDCFPWCKGSFGMIYPLLTSVLPTCTLCLIFSGYLGSVLSKSDLWNDAYLYFALDVISTWIIFIILIMVSFCGYSAAKTIEALDLSTQPVNLELSRYQRME